MIQHNHQDSEAEISMLELVSFFYENWGKILAGGIIGSSLGMGYIFIAPLKYQAIANIQVSKVAGTDVEPPNVLVEKLKMPMYYTQNTFLACNVIELEAPGEAIAKELKPTLSKNAPIISIAYKGKSIESSKNCLESVLNNIRVNQNEISKPMLESRINQLNNLKQKLESAENISKILSAKNTSFNFSDSKFSASTLLLATILNKENEVKDLRTQINEMEILLSEPQTKGAFLTTAVYAPITPVNKRELIVLLGGIGGAFSALCYLIVRKYLKNINILNKVRTRPQEK
jgi:uncharacterized protein involved in exopolysaccharide biosynthesis